MKCPECKNSDSRVLETRVYKDSEIRRRRECTDCKSRFTTVETVFVNYPLIKKRDGCQEPFSKEKLRKGIQLACLKRPVSLSQIEDIVGKVTKTVLEDKSKSVTAIDIGLAVVKELKQLDDVAYVRFASVYKEFKDVKEFVETLQKDFIFKPRNENQH